MENLALINREDLNEIFTKLNEIHRFIIKGDIKPARHLQEKWLSSNEAAQVLRCSVRSLHNYLNQGLLIRRRHKRRLYFLAEDLEKFMEGKYGFNPDKLIAHRLYKHE